MDVGATAAQAGSEKRYPVQVRLPFVRIQRAGSASPLAAAARG
jgi:hypothetical protein